METEAVTAGISHIQSGDVTEFTIITDSNLGLRQLTVGIEVTDKASFMVATTWIQLMQSTPQFAADFIKHINTPATVTIEVNPEDLSPTPAVIHVTGVENITDADALFTSLAQPETFEAVMAALKERAHNLDIPVVYTGAAEALQLASLCSQYDKSVTLSRLGNLLDASEAQASELRESWFNQYLRDRGRI